MIKIGAFYLKKAPVTLTTRAVRCFASKWEEKEKSAEKQFFNKEEEKLLKKLNEKLQRERYVAESGKSEADFKNEQLKKVKDVFTRYKIKVDNDAVFDELYAWKFNE